MFQADLCKKTIQLKFMSANLSPEQLEQFTQSFKLLDVDGDGRITANELQAIMKKFQLSTSQQQIKAIIRKIDTDGNGTIELHEFISFISSMAAETKQGEEDDLKKVFNMFDKDHNGLITKQELKQGMLQLGESMSEDDIMQLINEADTDGDGYISYQQFIQLMKFK